MERKKFFMAIIIVLVLIVILSALFYKKNNKDIYGDRELSGLEKEISFWLKEEHNLENVNVYLKNKQVSARKGFYCFCTFEYKGEVYQGIFFEYNEKIVDGDFTPVGDNPYTVHTYSKGSAKNPEVYLAGIINDKRIAYISVYYNDGSVTIIEPINKEYYFNLCKFGITKIVAYDENDKEILNQ